MAKETKMAFEGRLLYGAAGSTASTLLENVRDVTVSWTKTTGDTTPRGDGTGPPVGSARVTRIDITIEFNMLNKSDDASLTAMLTAMAAGTPVALRGEAYTSGNGPDFDFILDVKNGQPRNGEQTYDFSAEATDESGRVPVLANLYT
jgi:hypothetical protein